LGKNIWVFMHNGLKITTKVNSNPFSPKSPVTN